MLSPDFSGPSQPVTLLPMPSYQLACLTACLRLGRRSAMAVRALPWALAASFKSCPRATCLAGHCGPPAEIAARMCLGTAPIGVSPSQHSVRQVAALNRGALDMHRMQNSTWAATTQTCERNGLRFKMRGAGGGPSPPSASPAGTATSASPASPAAAAPTAPSSSPRPCAAAAAPAAASPHGPCTARWWERMAWRVRTQAS